MSFAAIIPARFAATRLPGKPLRDLAGRPIIQHVYERACESGADPVIVATDDERIRKAAEQFGARVCLTSDRHRSGSERLAEVIEQLKLDDREVVVNVQGDEPLIPPALIRQVAELALQHPDAGIATLCAPITQADELFNPNVVKVVLDERGHALYFSRAPIPWARDAFAADRKNLPADATFYRHIGLYAYRAGFLRQYVQWPVAALEQWESLEQLRALAHGIAIVVAPAEQIPEAGVDTEQDLERINRLLAADASRT